jgi:hypothetical protein
MIAIEDLANTMLADRVVVISDHETFEEIYEAAVAGDDEARKIIWTLSGMKAHHDREGFCCVGAMTSFRQRKRSVPPLSFTRPTATTWVALYSAFRARGDTTTRTISSLPSARRVRRRKRGTHERAHYYQPPRK